MKKTTATTNPVRVSSSVHALIAALWTELDARRRLLFRHQLMGGLAAAQEAELERLERLATRYESVMASAQLEPIIQQLKDRTSDQ